MYGWCNGNIPPLPFLYIMVKMVIFQFFTFFGYFDAFFNVFCLKFAFFCCFLTFFMFFAKLGGIKWAILTVFGQNIAERGKKLTKIESETADLSGFYANCLI